MDYLIYSCGIYCLGCMHQCLIHLHLSCHLLFAATGARDIAVAKCCLGKGDTPLVLWGTTAGCVGNKGLKATLK